jgi:hypothetical protein
MEATNEMLLEALRLCVEELGRKTTVGENSYAYRLGNAAIKQAESDERLRENQEEFFKGL